MRNGVLTGLQNSMINGASCFIPEISSERTNNASATLSPLPDAFLGHVRGFAEQLCFLNRLNLGPKAASTYSFHDRLSCAPTFPAASVHR